MPVPEKVVDRGGKAFGEVDFRAADHIEVVVNGTDVVRIGREHFEGRGEGASPRLVGTGDGVFAGKRVTTIDGIDVGEVWEVVRGEGGRMEALVVGGGGEERPSAVPLRFVREVSAHIILEPSAGELEAAQRDARRSPAVAAALRRAAKRG